MSEQERKAIIKAIKAIASALLLCETDARFAMNRRIDYVYEAINELNGMMGGGECEWVLREKWPNRTGDDHVYGYETSCGARHTWWPDSLPNYCPKCGAKVRKAVKR